ncbi:hypothetical protein L7F22_058861 [Adiantum nelumboides]|nr:hypothetical protein [Adiantum nelumboides]
MPVEEVKEVKEDLFLAVSQSMDVVPEPCQPSPSKTAAALKISKHFDQGAPLMADVALEPCQGAPSMLDMPGCTAYCCDQGREEGSFKGPTARTSEKRKAKADVKEKEGTAVLEQHNVKKLKKMKEVGVREVAFEQKLVIDEVTGHTGKG